MNESTDTKASDISDQCFRCGMPFLIPGYASFAAGMIACDPCGKIINEALGCPLPESQTPTGTEARVCKLIAERQRKGIAKYGASLSEAGLSKRALLWHAMEEALDLAMYLMAEIERMDRESNYPPTAMELAFAQACDEWRPEL